MTYLVKRETHTTNIISVQTTAKKSECYTDYIYIINNNHSNENFVKKDMTVTIDTYSSIFFNSFPL